MQRGIVLPTYLYDVGRSVLARAAFESLAKTVVESDAHLLIIRRPASYDVLTDDVMTVLANKFTVELIQEPSNCVGTEQTLAYGTQHLFDGGCAYVTWMGDDALFHPLWWKKLEQLTLDKPEAKAWSVYRSAYEEFHQTVQEEDDYAQATTLCGHGMTFSKQEWQAWGIDWQVGSWNSYAGDTLDLYHSQMRGGEYWTTKVSYVEHTGKVGIHCRAEMPEHAVLFQGTES